MSSVLRNYRKIYTTPGADPSMPGRVSNLETNEYKVTYYQVVTGTSGTLTVPSGGTINPNEFGLSGNAILSKVDVNGKPTFESPTTSGGSQVTASLNVLTGAWVASGVYTSSSVALIYSIKIKGIDYHNLVYNNIIETVKVTADVSTINLQSVTDGGSNTTHVIETAGYVKTGGLSTQFLKADGSIDSNTYLTSGSISGFVPYTGATANLDLGTYNLTADHIALNVNPSGAGFVVGATQWNNTMGSSETLLKGGNVVLKNGVDLVARIVNKVVPNTTLTKAAYQVVRVSGAVGGRLAVELAQANSDLNSADTLGVAIETIATNQEGFIITVGQLLEVDTTGSLQGETWIDGDVLYLSPSTPGKITNIKPTGATGHIVVLGYVEYAHAVHGAIYIKIMNGWELDELHNVYINQATLANNDILTYESSTSLWKNKTVVSALGYTPYNATNPSGFITSSALTPYLTTASAALTYFPIPTGTTSQYLRGDGTLATFPTIPTVTPSVLTKTDDTNVTLTLGGSPSTALLAATSITVGWTGTLADSRIASASTWNAKQDALSGTGFVKSTAGVISYDTNTYLTTSSASSTYVPYTGATGNVDLGLNTLFTPLVQAPGTLTLNANGGNIALKSYGATIFTYTTQGFSATPVAATSGFSIAFSLTKPNNTNQTASSNIPGFNYIGGSRQWATGNIALQTENGWGAVTYSFVGASTITNAYGNVFNAPIAGTNATITNNWSANFTAKINVSEGINAFRGTREIFVGVNTDTGLGDFPGIWFNTSGSRTVFNYAFLADNTNTIFNAPSTGTLLFRIANSQKLRIFESGNVTIQNAGTYTDNGYRLDVQGTANVLTSLNVGNYATPSSQRMLTVGQDTAFVTIGSVPSSTSQGGIWINQTTPSANNAVVYATPTVTTFQSSGNLYLRANGANVALITQNNFSFSPYLTNAGASENFTFTKPNNTNQTLSTSIAGWNYNGGSRQWATGAITTQSENVWGAVTYSFVGASTITNAFGNVFNAPIAGTNCTITSNWAARFNGAIYVDSPTGAIFDNSAGSNIIRIRRTGGTIETIISATGGGAFIGSSTVHSTNIQSAGVVRMSFSGIGNGDCTFADGMKWICGSTLGNTFGSANTQKLAFWNATPIVQPANTTSLNGVLENTGLMASGSTISTINKPLVVGANTTPRTGVATDGVTSVLGNLQNFTTNYHSGEVLYNEVSGEALNFGQLCYRNAAGKWQKATGSSSTIAAYNMLGICLQTVGAVDTAISILTRGYVESTYLSAGAVGNPLFMDATTAGSITNTAPSTAGNVVRVIGNVFWSSALQTNSKWIVYFNPDNTWIEL
jgi:hypothetical protein